MTARIPCSPAAREASDARYQHFGDPRQDAVAHEFRADEIRFEPRRRRAASAQQRQGGTGVGAYHSRHQKMPGPLDGHGGGVAFGRIRGRQEVDNSPVAHHQCMVLEHSAPRSHWHYPTGVDA